MSNDAASPVAPRPDPSEGVMGDEEETDPDSGLPQSSERDVAAAAEDEAAAADDERR